MRILALVATITGAGLIGVSAGGITSADEQLRAAAAKCPHPHVRHERDL